ncbi:MAG: aquaporin [Flavobacteriales bacterium]|jgi:aquaporin Z|tara:strand:- start:78 stop:725 length:648 start_codon:yes stop_codon:yes gene_type:complete
MKRYFLELFGTFALVFCGAGAIVMNDASGGAVTHVGIALTFGLIVMAMIYSIGAQSGAHINPAVTIAFWASGTFDKKDVFPYVAAQITGAVLASAVLYCLFPEHATQGATLPLNSYSQAFVIEVLLSFILMFVIVNVSEGSKETGKMAGIAIGGVVALEALFAGPITGASMNPARSIGPALFSGELQYLSLYSAAPIVGMLLATLFCKLTQAKAA